MHKVALCAQTRQVCALPPDLSTALQGDSQDDVIGDSTCRCQRITAGCVDSNWVMYRERTIKYKLCGHTENWSATQRHRHRVNNSNCQIRWVRHSGKICYDKLPLIFVDVKCWSSLSLRQQQSILFSFLVSRFSVNACYIFMRSHDMRYQLCGHSDENCSGMQMQRHCHRVHNTNNCQIYNPTKSVMTNYHLCF